MGRLFRMALEGTETKIKVEGPLSEVYSKALEIVYRKEEDAPDDTPSISVETQVMDIADQIKALDLLNKQKQIVKPVTVYGCLDTSVSSKDVVNIINLAKGVDPAKDQSEVVVVRDNLAMQNNPTNDPRSWESRGHSNWVEINTALENVCALYNIPIFKSLREALESIK